MNFHFFNQNSKLCTCTSRFYCGIIFIQRRGGGQCLRVPHYRSHKHWSPTNTCNNDSTVCYILCSSSWQLTFPFKPTWYWAVKKYSSENSMLPVWNKTMYKMPRASLVKAGPTLSLKKQKHSVQSAHRHCKT